MATTTAPTTDLQRIQQSYTSGSQVYRPGKEKPPEASRPTAQEDRKQTTRDLSDSLALQA
jgi:hypothetical protein